MAALKINFIFCNLAFNDAIARMDDAERLRTLDRLREAIANCPNALGLASFWAHMQSCSNDEWRLTMERIDEVGRPAQRTVALAALGPSAALRHCCVPALWLRGGSGMCCACVGADRRLRQHGPRHGQLLGARRQGLRRRVGPDGRPDR